MLSNQSNKRKSTRKMMKKYPFFFQALTLALSAGLAMSGSVLAKVGIEQNPLRQSPASSSQTLLARLSFRVRGVRPSRYRIGGFSRGNCKSDQQENSSTEQEVSLMALLPKINAANLSARQIEVESTVAARPTFFIHVPKTMASEAEFYMVNEKREIVHQEMVQLTGSSGIVGVTLPADVNPLEIGQSYHWEFSILCDSTGDVSGNPRVEGWVQRIELEPNLAEQIEAAPPRQRPSIYAENGIWTDTIMELAKLRQTAPSDRQLEQDWVELLESAGLQAIAREPLTISMGN